MNGKNLLHDTIKNKLEQHEFEFDPDAWESMEVLLSQTFKDKSPNEEVEQKPKFPFFTILIFGIMTTFFTILIWIFFATPDKSLPINGVAKTSETPSVEVAPNRLIPTIQKLKKKPSNPVVTKVVAFEPPPIFALNTPPDSNLLATAFTRFNDYFQPEKVFIQLDKTIYAPHETVWFAVFTRKANDFLPARSEFVHVELIAPNGNTLQTLILLAKNGVAAGDFRFQPNMVGGLYKIKAYTRWQQQSGDFFEKTLQVQSLVLPKLNMKLEFQRKAYSSGDEVVADLTLQNIDNQPLIAKNFDFTVSLKGGIFLQKNGQTDGKGKATIRFLLPNDLTNNDGLLNVLIPHNGSTESIARPVPIVLNKIDLQFLPEGGDWVAGLFTQVAFKALNEFGKPADVEGTIFDENGVQVSTFQSYYQGMGRFDFIPQKGKNYTAKITKPVGITTVYHLPLVQENGVVLTVLKQEKEKISVRVASSQKTDLTLVATTRTGVRRVWRLPNLEKEAILNLPTEGFPIGITHLTLFDATNQPIAERLVFMNPHKKLYLDLTTDKPVYGLRETVRGRLRVTDENGKPVQGQFVVSAADETLLTLADDKQSNLLTYFLLESDLKGKVEEGDFYFETPEKEDRIDRKRALDDVLLTHGWRRFEWANVLQMPNAGQFATHETTDLVGSVVDAFNNPLAHATVTVEGTNFATTTNAQGKFELKRLQILPPFAITAQYEEFTNRLILEGFNENPRLQLMAKFERSVLGSVLDSYRKLPLEDAQIRLLDKKGEVVEVLSSEKDGSFKFEKVNFHRQATLEVTYDGITQQQPVSQFVSGKTALFLMPVNPIGEVHGIVSDQSFQPLEGVTVSIGEEQTTTNKHGQFRFKKVDYSKVKHATAQYDGISLKLLLPEKDNLLRFAFPANVHAQTIVTYSPSSNLKNQITGVLTDGETGEPLIFATVVLYSHGNILAGTQTDWDGKFKLDNLDDGVYSLKVDFIGYNSLKVPDVTVKGQQNAHFSLEIHTGQAHLSEVVVTAYQVPTVVSDNSTAVQSVLVQSGKIEHLPYKNISGIIASPAGIANQPTINLGIEVGDLPTSHVLTWLEINGTPAEFANEKEQIERFDQVEEDLDIFTHDLKPKSFKNKNLSILPNKNGYYKTRTFYTPSYNASEAAVRNDFRTTLFWKHDLETDENGEATFEFPNGDTETNYRLTVAGFGNEGEIGLRTTQYAVEMRFSMHTKTPPTVLTGDELTVPITFKNNSDSDLTGDLIVQTPFHFQAQGSIPTQVTIPARSVVVIPMSYRIGDDLPSGQVFEIVFKSDSVSERFVTRIPTLRRGFPVAEIQSGSQLSKDFEIEITQPLANTLTASMTVHPSVLSDLVTGLERMIEQPGGCFEQVTSSNYPNLLALQFMRENDIQNQKIEAQAERFLQMGYEKLTAYEVEGGGFDWWGKAPAHEGLTAYGLMQFVDMTEVYSVEQDLIDRTVAWLMSRRDGQGGWLINKKHLHAWANNATLFNAYIAWAMTSAGYSDQVQPEIEELYEPTLVSEDPYLMALAANTYALVQDERADTLLDALLKMQQKDGSWQGKTTSITSSSGKDLQIETTALVALALLEADYKAEKVLQQAIDFLSGSKSEYGFGSTQATVLAMKALVRYAQNQRATSQGGAIVLYQGDHEVRRFNYDGVITEPIAFTGLQDFLKEGKNKLKLRFEGFDKALPYDLTVQYTSKKPKTSPQTGIFIQVSILDTLVKVGETVRMTIDLTTDRYEMLPNPIAIVGIPSGLTVQPWQLRKLQDENKADYIELWNGFIVFYFRELAQTSLNLDLKAEVPGKFEAPASSAYLYYNQAYKSWSLPPQVRVVQ